MNVIQHVDLVFNDEITALHSVRKQFSNTLGDDIVTVVHMINECKGRIVLVGMGKSGHIAKKIAATMASIGIQAYFMHAGEGLHGDLGIVQHDDLVIMLSNSGETDEIISLFPTLNRLGVKTVGIVGKQNSTLEKLSNVTLVLPKVDEAFLDNIVPTNSTTCMLVLGDAIAVAVAKMRNFTKNDFAIYHPNGTLGKKLTLKVRDIMLPFNKSAIVLHTDSVQTAIYEMCAKPMGGVNVICNNKLVGVFTDGDLRRVMSNAILDEPIEKYMTKNPLAIDSSVLVVDALHKMYKENGTHISMLPVIENDNLVGTITLAEIGGCGLL